MVRPNMETVKSNFYSTSLSICQNAKICKKKIFEIIQKYANKCKKCKKNSKICKIAFVFFVKKQFFQSPFNSIILLISITLSHCRTNKSSLKSFKKGMQKYSNICK